MSKGKKTGGRDFKSGESGNPSGRPKIPREIQIALSRFKYDLGDTVVKLFQSSISDLKEIRSSEESTGIEFAIARAILDSDFKLIEILLGRAIGKAPDEVNHPDSGWTLPIGHLERREIDCEF